MGRHWDLGLVTYIINSFYCLCHCRPCWDQALLWTGIHCRNKSSTQLLHWVFQAWLNRKHFSSPTKHKLLAYVKKFSHFFPPDSIFYTNSYTETNQPRKQTLFQPSCRFFFFKLCGCIITKCSRVKLRLNFLQKSFWNTRNNQNWWGITPSWQPLLWSPKTLQLPPGPPSAFSPLSCDSNAMRYRRRCPKAALHQAVPLHKAKKPSSQLDLWQTLVKKKKKKKKKSRKEKKERKKRPNPEQFCSLGIFHILLSV